MPEAQPGQDIRLGMGQRGAEDLADRTLKIKDPVARGVDDGAVRCGGARPDRDVPGAQRLPGLAESFLPGIVQVAPERPRRYFWFHRRMITEPGTRGYWIVPGRQGASA